MESHHLERMFGRRPTSSEDADPALACVREIAADFQAHAARIRSMAEGRTPTTQARLHSIAQAFEDRGSTLLERARA
jgi:hypothetical protein